ncbi:uncharacterized protein [Mytilus edulis]|uniref:uncharacterized protein n=1 Tax=Mytilus edulis TaxID=6550 RepID=UPI0039EEAD64
MGFGNMLNKFVRGSALTDGRPQVFCRYKTFMPESIISPMKMTPEKYTYSFLQGKSKEIAQEQLTRLQDISVEKGNSTEITQSIPGPSSCTTSNVNQIELNKRKRELFNTTTKGKAPKRKSTTKARGPKTSEENNPKKKDTIESHTPSK